MLEDLHPDDVASTSEQDEHSAPRVLLLLDHAANRGRIAAWLPDRYEVETRRTVDGPLDPSYDLCIVDEGAFERHHGALTANDDGVFQPVLLVSSTDATSTDSAVWEVADEVVPVPTDRTTLYNRVENLLERRRLSRRLAADRDRAESLFRKVFEYTNDAVYVVDLDRGVVTDANRAATDLLGYGHEALVSMPVAALHPPDEDALDAFAESVAAGSDGWTGDLTYVDSDGAEIPTEVSAAHLELGGSPHLVVSVRDVSERRAAERRRRESARYRRRLYDITSSTDRTFPEKVDAVLELGCERLGAENGHLVSIDEEEGRHEVVAAGGTDMFEAGDTTDLATTYCRRIIADDGILAVNDAPAEGWADDPAYRTHGLDCYVGAKVEVDGELFGTVCFADSEARETPFTEREKTFVELVARWLSHELEREEHERLLRDLHEVTEDLMEAETPADIARRTADAVEQLFDFDIACVRLLDETGTSLRPAAVTAATDRHLSDPPLPYEVGEGFVGEAFESGEPTVVDDLQAVDAPFDYGSIGSAACLPLGDHGTLGVGAVDVDGLDDDDVRELEILAADAASALTRAEREASLRETTQYQSALFENATDAIVELELEDDEPVVSDVNSGFEAVFGHDADEARGESLTDLVVPESRREEARELVERAREGDPFETEVRRETASGRRDFIFRVAPIVQDGEILGGYGIYTDITDRKRREQQVQVLNRVLRHNLRNKLNVIQGHAARIADELEGDAADAVEEVLAASDELERLSRKAEPVRRAGGDAPETTGVDAAAVAREVSEDLSAEHPDASVTVDAPHGAWVEGNGHLATALTELVENAILHGGPAPAVRVTVDADDGAGGWVQLTVADDGPGIPAEERAVLRAGEETQLDHASGLGLWLVNWIVRHLGGELSIDDRPSGGTTVTMSLPVADEGRRHPEA